jgi:hypothetical protein
VVIIHRISFGPTALNALKANRLSGLDGLSDPLLTIYRLRTCAGYSPIHLTRRYTNIMLFVLYHLLLDRSSCGKVARFSRYSAPAIYLVLATVIAQPVQAANSYSLIRAETANRLQRVRSVLDVKGELKLNADGKQVRRLPLKVQGDLVYDEQFVPEQQKDGDLATAKQELNSVRYYHQTKAVIEVGKGKSVPLLAEHHRVVRVDHGQTRATLYSPNGPMTREELELIDIPCNTLIVEQLLPGRLVKLNESWKPDNDLLAGLLGLDTIATTNVNCTLKSVEDNKATIAIAGSVDGAVEGIVSALELEGNFQFDLTNKAFLWLNMVIKENREIGHAQPGFEVEARVRMVAKPLLESPALNDVVVKQARAQTDITQKMLAFQSQTSGFKMLHQRQWQVMIDRPDNVILRHIDRGNLITQCNIRSLSRLGKGEQLTLEGFRDDIQVAMKNAFGEFIEAEEKAENGIKIIRIVVSGTVSELPVQWTYYHLSDDNGRRASMVFTTESNLLERFAQADELLVTSFEFTPLPAPTAAEKPQVAAEKDAAPTGDEKSQEPTKKAATAAAEDGNKKR